MNENNKSVMITYLCNLKRIISTFEINTTTFIVINYNHFSLRKPDHDGTASKKTCWIRLK